MSNQAIAAPEHSLQRWRLITPRFNEGCAMPLFYFDVVDDGKATPDEWGIELEDITEARDQAQALVPDLAREKILTGDRKDISVIVRCSEGRPCYRTTLTIQGVGDFLRELMSADARSKQPVMRTVNIAHVGEDRAAGLG